MAEIVIYENGGTTTAEQSQIYVPPFWREEGKAQDDKEHTNDKQDVLGVSGV